MEQGGVEWACIGHRRAFRIEQRRTQISHPCRPSNGQNNRRGAGFNELFAGGRIVEAACWAHVRRKFFDVTTASASPIAKEALDRIGALYTVEKTINAARPDRRRQERPTGDDKNDSGARNRLPTPCRPGPKARCASSRANPNSPKPSATCGRAGLHWCAASTRAAWHSTTIPPSVPCAASPLAVKIICLPAPMLAAAAPPRSIH